MGLCCIDVNHRPKQQGRLKEYIGGYQDYIDAKSREEKIQTTSAPKAAAEPEKAKPKANRTVKLSYKEQRELDALPDDRKSLHDLRAALDGAIAGFEGVLAQTAGGPLADPLAAAQLTTRATEIARLAREHNDANVLSLGGRMQSHEEAWQMVEVFLTTEFTGEERHQRRIDELTTWEQTGRL